jgi:hypothetical protein
MAEIGRKGGESSRGGRDDDRGGHRGGQSTRGGTREQHPQAGRQSHKKD